MSFLYPDQLFAYGSQFNASLSVPRGCPPRNWRPTAVQYATDTIVTLYVGTTEKRYNAHKQLLTESSLFFKAALSNDAWIEAVTNIIHLPDDDAQIFAFVLNWIYSDVFHKSELETNPIVRHISISEYLQIYNMADKLMMQDCKDSVSTRIRAFHSDELLDAVGSGQISDSLILDNSRLQKFFIDKFAYELVFNGAKYRTSDSIDSSELKPEWSLYFTGPNRTSTAIQILNGAATLRRVWQQSSPLARLLSQFTFRNPVHPVDCRYHEHDQ